jgi:glutaredoxin
MPFSRYFKAALLTLLAVVLLSGMPLQSSRAFGQREVAIYFFWGNGCPHCAEAKPFLNQLASTHSNVQLHSYEVWHSPQNQDLFLKLAEAAQFEPSGVPTIFVGNHYWVGYSPQIRQEIEAQVRSCALRSCPDIAERVVAGTPETDKAPVSTTSSPGVLTIPLLGSIQLASHSLLFSTAIIAFVDGFNPCSLWVLSVLLALTLHTGSRRKVLLIGSVFLAVTSLIYALFIVGLFTALTFVSFLGWIQVLVALLALFFAVVNIKDYFWFQEGLSFTIDESQKPTIYKRMRNVLAAGNSLGGLILATVALSAGVSIVEFSCTAGFPVLWSNLLISQHVHGLFFGALLLIYMFIYQLDEMAIFLGAVVTLRTSKLEEIHGRVLKLIGGMVMLSLAIVMLINPALMNNLGSTLMVFGIALGSTLLVILVHRIILPHFGIVIGTERLSKPSSPGKRASQPRD